jgi:hypothetical protein
MALLDRDRLADRGVWSLAAVFGVASVPWTYAFVTAGVPLWPSFVASATYYAAGEGRGAYVRATASNAAGVAYAVGTLAAVDALGGGTVTLAVVVGVAMFLASLHAAVPLLSFTPGGFFGYATMFSVHAAGATVAFGGLPGETVAATLSMGVGAVIGLGTDRLSALAA